MFTDPLSMPFGPETVTLNRTAVSGSSSVYEGHATLDSTEQGTYNLPAENDLVLSVTHTRNKRKRSVIRLDHSGLFTGAVSGTLVPGSSSIYLVIDRPIGQYTDTAMNAIAQSFLYKIYHGTSSDLTTEGFKFINGQS